MYRICNICGQWECLQFRNVHIKDGRFLDSCIVLGTNSSYTVSEDDHAVLECGDEDTSESGKYSELAIEIQAISPELTFYNISRNVADSLVLSNKLLHAQLDAFCRFVLKGDNMEMTANTLGLTMESNGIRILEPFDTSIKFSNVSGIRNMHLSASDIYMNFSFSILRLFLAVEEDLLAVLRMTSWKMTINTDNDQVYSFWRPRAPPGFAILDDYLTPTDKPPTKAVIAVNMNLVNIKRPYSFKLICQPITSVDIRHSEGTSSAPLNIWWNSSCSIRYPVAPKGYIAMGCVVSSGTVPPPASSSFCISASLVSSCPMRDCVMIGDSHEHSMAFWRVDNCIGSFLPTYSS